MIKKLTLSVEAALIDQMKIRCILEKRELSSITEKLYRDYLERSVKVKTGKTTRPNPDLVRTPWREGLSVWRKPYSGMKYVH